MPDEYLTATIRAYEESTEKYIASTTDFIWLEQFEKIVSFAGLRSGDAVLDIGCGFGRDAVVFCGLGLSVTGVDMSGKMLATARNRAPCAEFFEMDMRELRFCESSFSAVWANASLLHLTYEDMLLALIECFRVLIPGGVLMASVKRGEGSGMILDNFSCASERHFTLLQPQSFRYLLEAAGFSLLEMTVENEARRFPGKGRDLEWLYSFSRKRVP